MSKIPPSSHSSTKKKSTNPTTSSSTTIIPSSHHSSSSSHPRHHSSSPPPSSHHHSSSSHRHHRHSSTSSKMSSPSSTAPSSSSLSGEVKTLYISGLPHDVKEREIQLLCRPYSGFEFCNLNTRSDTPSAFVKFSDRESAATALSALQNFQFDLNHPEVIRVDFARSDTMKKYLNPEDYDEGPDGKRRRISGKRSGDNLYGYPSDGYYQHYGYPHTYGPSYYPYYPPSYSSYSGSSASSGGGGSHSNATNTLFVGNLPSYCSESDLSPLFRHHPGFKTMRFTSLKNRQVGFVQFVDASSANFALSQMSGTRLFGNTLRIEFAQESKDPNRRKSSPSSSSSSSQHSNKHVGEGKGLE